MTTAHLLLLFYALVVLAFPFAGFRYLRLADRKGAGRESGSFGRYRIAALGLLGLAGGVFLLLWLPLFRILTSKHLVTFGLASTVVFAGVVLVGYFWTRKKGAFRCE